MMTPKESFILIRQKYKTGVYSLKDMFYLVKIGTLTEEEFEDITTYYYEGLKETRGW